MVQVEIRYLGDLRCSATHGPSQINLTTDAPLDNQGLAESYSPTDLVATALGTCMLTIMGIVARKHVWDIRGTTVRVTKHMVSTPIRKIASIETELHIPIELGPEEQKQLENAAHSCPVYETLKGNVEMPVRFVWGKQA